MNWDALATMAAALMAFIALNAGTLRWLFGRHESVQAEQIASLKARGQRLLARDRARNDAA
jgi:hypothetical protein